MNYFSSLLFLLLPLCVFSQSNGRVNGVVEHAITQEKLSGVTIALIGKDTVFTKTSESGEFAVDIPTGNYQIEASMVGFRTAYLFSVIVGSGSAQVLAIGLEPQSINIDEIEIRPVRTARATDMVTPLSTQKLTAEEIKVNPGGNFDVSKVIQVLPGVAGGTSANRNDIIVRGGGPSENVYYLDGIEIPVLNHFQTQGASGGATGILNVSFINDVQLTSSAFDSRYDNALASTFVIKQRNGNPERLGGNLRLSGSELAGTLEGPLGDKTTFLASARRSYLQFLFKLLDLPIRPDYWDFQFKVNHKMDQKTELTMIGLGAIDNFKIAAPKDADAETAYIVRANPLIKQWNYTVGASLKRLVDDGYYTVALSRNMFFNGADRYEDNALASGDKLFSLGSHEVENKLRVDVNRFIDGWRFSYGLGAQYVKYDAELFNTLPGGNTDPNGGGMLQSPTFSSSTAIDFFRMGAYIHSSKYFLDEKLLLSGGVRSDVNTYTSSGMNPLETLSPRLSASYALGDAWNISGSIGSYFKLPAYTALGYVNEEMARPNRNLYYINSVHYTVGTQYIPRNDFRLTAEAFYKNYRNYPVSQQTGISMANVGTDFSAIGNEPYVSTGSGRVYGMEAYAQQKLVRNLFYVLSATIYRSEFTGVDGVYRPSTWDYGYIVSSALGYKMKRGWDVGLKYRIAGGQPYTPFDMEASRALYLTSGQGVADYTLLNGKRLPLYNQLDIRVDKKFNFKRTSLTLFVDVQNALLAKTPSLPKYTFMRNADNSGFETTDGQPVSLDGSNAFPLILNDRSATVVPAIGFIFDF